jgi:uncharacterized small protein (DUF1192 family)
VQIQLESAHTQLASLEMELNQEKALAAQTLQDNLALLDLPNTKLVDRISLMREELAMLEKHKNSYYL